MNLIAGGQRDDAFSELDPHWKVCQTVLPEICIDVGGNKYRVVGLVAFRSKRIFVLFVGTHAQDDAIDVKEL